MNIDQNLHFLRPDQTTGRLRRRQDGAPFPHAYPSGCRRWGHGRRQNTCPLPKGVRPPREKTSHPLLSGYAVIMLNTFIINRDGFPVPHRQTAQKPTAAVL